ncbi:hypothetical protein BC936DRAFT_137785, partial [Jimgerdemannia flammicorona]
PKFCSCHVQGSRKTLETIFPSSEIQDQHISPKRLPVSSYPSPHRTRRHINRVKNNNMQFSRTTKTQTKRPSLSIPSLVIVVCLLAFLCTPANASPIEKRQNSESTNSIICGDASTNNTVAINDPAYNRAPATATGTTPYCATATVDPNNATQTDFPSYLNDEYYQLTGSEITLTAGTVGSAFLIVGFYFGAFGYRFARVTLGLIGLLLFAALTYIALVNAEPYWGYSQPNHIIFTAIPFAIGILGALIFAIFYTVVKYVIGGLGGFILVLYVLAYQEDHIILSSRPFVTYTKLHAFSPDRRPILHHRRSFLLRLFCRLLTRDVHHPPRDLLHGRLLRNVWPRSLHPRRVCQRDPVPAGRELPVLRIRPQLENVHHARLHSAAYSHFPWMAVCAQYGEEVWPRTGSGGAAEGGEGGGKH